MPVAQERKCKRRLDKKNPKHKRRHTTLCKALAKNKCLTKKGNLRKTKKCYAMNSAVNLEMSRRGVSNSKRS